VDQAKPGQVLAEQIARPDGVLLASQGSQVTDGLLRMLVRLNIDTISIEEEERRTPEEISAIHQKEVERIDKAFVKVTKDSVLWALQKTMVFLSEQERNKSLALLEADSNPPADHPNNGVSTEEDKVAGEKVAVEIAEEPLAPKKATKGSSPGKTSSGKPSKKDKPER
jgi:hypothetical protein